MLCMRICCRFWMSVQLQPNNKYLNGLLTVNMMMHSTCGDMSFSREVYERNEVKLMCSWICVCASNHYGKTDWNRYDYIQVYD